VAQNDPDGVMECTSNSASPVPTDAHHKQYLQRPLVPRAPGPLMTTAMQHPGRVNKRSTTAPHVSMDDDMTGMSAMTASTALSSSSTSAGRLRSSSLDYGTAVAAAAAAGEGACTPVAYSGTSANLSVSLGHNPITATTPAVTLAPHNSNGVDLSPNGKQKLRSRPLAPSTTTPTAASPATASTAQWSQTRR